MSVPVSIMPYRSASAQLRFFNAHYVQGVGELSVVRLKNEVALEFHVIGGGTCYMRGKMGALVLPLELVDDLIADLEAVRDAPPTDKRLCVVSWWWHGVRIRR